MTTAPEIVAAIRVRATELGFDLVGFARADGFVRERELILESLSRGRLDGMGWITADRVRLSCDPEALHPGSRTIIALGTSYAPVAGSPSVDSGLRGRVARYAWGRDYHDVIPPRLEALSATLVELFGTETRNRRFVDTGPLVDRAASERAGLGFVGKNTCVLTGPLGSYVFLSAILTTAELPPDPVVTRDCGACRACLDACPTGALIAPQTMDATRCISYLTIEHRGPIPEELRPSMGNWVFGCDVCQEVCPWNRVRPTGLHTEFAPDQGAGSNLDLIELLSLDEAGFRARFRGTPLTRTKRRGLLRNAAVALGNLNDPAAIPALLAALRDPEPLVRSHAAWALSRLVSLPAEAVRELETVRDCETDPVVREEIISALWAIEQRAG